MGRVYPKTPVCYGFSVVAKAKPGRERAGAITGKAFELAVVLDAIYQLIVQCGVYILEVRIVSTTLAICALRSDSRSGHSPWTAIGPPNKKRK